jgi:hypothetical protein
MMNEYVAEERTKGIRMQLSFNEPNVVGTTTPPAADPFGPTITSVTSSQTRTNINQPSSNNVGQESLFGVPP